MINGSDRITMSTHQISNYLNSTSPIKKYQLANRIPLKDIHNSVDIKLHIMSTHSKGNSTPKIKKRGKCLQSAKNNERTQIQEYQQLKANSIIYNIPEISPPQIIFEVSNLLRSRINQIKSDIITKFPSIKSSQYNSNKIQNTFSHRGQLKDLQDWLKQKLKNPPLTQQDSIEYKNMIMGIGMKQVIRLIGIRCNEQANFVSEIWQLTWSICRQIILYLSNRAHQCEKILEDEATFFRVGCEKKMNQYEEKIKQLKQQNIVYKQRSEKLAKDLSKLRKRNKQLKLLNIQLSQLNTELKSQFESLFKQNILFHLKYDENRANKKKEWKKKLEILSSRSINRQFKQFIKKLMKENYLHIDQQDQQDLSLIIDINQFKDEQLSRKKEIQEEIMRIFNNKQQSIQTNIIQFIDQNIQTSSPEFQQLGIQTQGKEFSSIQINTDETFIKVLKEKEKKESKIKNIKKPMKSFRSSTRKEQNKPKFKQTHKLPIDITPQPSLQMAQVQQNEQNIDNKSEIKDIQYEKQQQISQNSGCDIIEKINDDIMESIQDNNIEQENIDRQDNNKKQAKLFYNHLNIEKNQCQYKVIQKYKTENIIQNEKNQIIEKISEVSNKSNSIIETIEPKDKKKIQKQSKQNRQISSMNSQIINTICSFENKKLDDEKHTNQHKNHEQSNKLSKYSKIYVTSEAKDNPVKDQETDELSMMIFESSRKNSEIQSLKSELSNRNKTISSLFLELQTLKQQSSQQPLKKLDKQNEDKVVNSLSVKQEIRTSNIIGEDQETQNLMNLVVQKNYQELLNILISKADIPDDILNDVEDEQLSYDDIINCRIGGDDLKKANASRFSCQLLKKKLVTREEKRKLSLNNYMGLSMDGTISEMDQQELVEEKHCGAIQNKKLPRRALSLYYGQTPYLSKFITKHSRVLQESTKVENNLGFSSMCYKYFFQSPSFEIGKSKKLNGLADHIKRNIREQYKQVYRQLPEKDYMQKNEKYMRILIEKVFNSLLKELCKEILSARKQGLQRLQQLKQNYSTLPILMLNRLNRNYGMKKVASKCIKDLILCLKGIRKYTDKYSIISYFMFSSNSILANNAIVQYQETQLFFFYILLITLFEGMLSDLEVEENEIVSIAIITKKHLTTDSSFINGLCQLPAIMRGEKNCNFINFYTKFICMYKDLYEKRINQLEFIYLALPKQLKNGVEGVIFQDFVQFLSVFSIKSNSKNQYAEQHDKNEAWMTTVIKCMTRVLSEEKYCQKGIITRQSYIKFLVKCPQFNLSLLNQYLDSVIANNVYDISDQATQNYLLSICSQHLLLSLIANYLLVSSNFKQNQLVFWIKYMKLYVLEKDVDQMMGKLLYGALDPRIKSILIKG